MSILRIASAVVAIIASTIANAQVSELLVVPVPPGWGAWKTVTNKGTAQFSLVERIPENQSTESIKDILVQQTYSGLSPQASPSLAITSIHRQVGSACEYSRINGPVTATENGYSVAYGQFYCTKQKGSSNGVIAAQKAIMSGDKIYVIQREWRLPPFEFETKGGAAGVISSKSFPSPEALLAWLDSFQTSLDYLGKRVFVCDASDEAKICRKGP